MKKKTLLLVVSVLLSLLVAVPILMSACAAEEAAPAPAPAKPAEVMKWRMQVLLGAGMWACDVGMNYFADTVREASDGRIDITVYGAGILVPSAEILEAVGTGTIEIGLGTGAYWSGTIPVGQIEHHVPFAMRNYMEMDSLWRDKGWLELFREAYAPHNAYFLGVIITAGNAVISTKPINSLDDMRKLKIRTASPGADILKKVGVPIVFVPGGEIYTALATGVIDGATWGAATSERDIKLYEVAKYFLKTYSGDIASECMIVNLDEWNALPDDLKADLALAEAAANDLRMRHYYVTEMTALKEMVDQHGVTVTELPAADVEVLKTAAMEFIDEVAAKDPEFTAPAVKILKDFMRELGYLK